jgi:hypothetical protein
MAQAMGLAVMHQYLADSLTADGKRLIELLSQ